VSIADNAGNSPQLITLYGTGEDFSISATSSSATISAGQTATYKRSIAPESGFNQPLSFTCAGAPPLATCTVAPASVTPGGSTASTVTATVTTTAKSMSPLGPTSTFNPFAGRPPWLPWLVWLLAFATLVGLLAARGRQAWSRRALLVGIGLLALSWAACGGGGGGGSGKIGSPGTPLGTYPLTVTGTYTAGQAMVQHYTKLMLKVT
jgi:hypothetical protein